MSVPITHAMSASPQIAKWYQDKRAAISLRFDDALESHVNFVIPFLNKHNIKATFMVNPDRDIFLQYQSFWENDVPHMGHHLGNHTLHHTGAKDLQEADYEIGEVSRLIWSLYPENSKLLVFASGGGEKWGGKYWEDADSGYKAIVQKYHLIDLYDGNHRSKGVRSSDTAEALCERINSVLASGGYQPFHFHNIGEPTLKDRLRHLLQGSSTNVERKVFSDFVACLLSKQSDIWIAPIIDILKYQTEYTASNITNLTREEDRISFDLRVQSDTALYDHELTLILPDYNSKKPVYIVQDGRRENIATTAGGAPMVNILPVSSNLTIYYR